MLQGASLLLNHLEAPIWLMEHNRQALSEHGVDSKMLMEPFTNYQVYVIPPLTRDAILES
jgi:hypothetical protein